MTDAGHRTADDESRNPERATVPRLCDLRTIIGSMFTLYGLVLTITGLVYKASDLTKSHGIRINLWLGLAMLALGLLFLLWVRLRPLRLDKPSAAAAADQTGDPSAPPDRSDTI